MINFQNLKKYNEETFVEKFAEGDSAGLNYLMELTDDNRTLEILSDVEDMSWKTLEDFPYDVYATYRDEQLNKLGIDTEELYEKYEELF